MKKLLLSVSSLLFCFSAFSQTIVIKGRDGITNFSTNAVRCIRFNNGNMSIVKINETQTDYELTKVAALGFGAINTAIVPTYEKGQVTYSDSKLKFFLLRPERLHIYNMSGQCVKSIRLLGGAATVNVIELPFGVYTMSCGTINFKFVR